MKTSAIFSVVIIVLALVLNSILTAMSLVKTTTLEGVARRIQSADQLAISTALAQVEPTLRQHQTELNNLSNRQQAFMNTLSSTVAEDMKQATALLDRQNAELIRTLKDHGDRITALENKVNDMYAMLQKLK